MRPRAASRRERERGIVAATRQLFDQTGLQDASIDEIARAVGINKALIYRHFSSKEELYVMTMTTYLTDLAVRLDEVDGALDPADKLEAGWRRYTEFCLEHPAFPDCSLSLMRRPAAELRERVSDSVWFRLGQAMADCLGKLSRILQEGAERGEFTVADPDFTANLLYTQTLGAMHLARLGVGVREVAPEIPGVFPVDAGRIQDACVAGALNAVGARTGAPAG